MLKGWHGGKGRRGSENMKVHGDAGRVINSAVSEAFILPTSVLWVNKSTFLLNFSWVFCLCDPKSQPV